MNSKLSNEIKAEALRLGFFACGIARAEAVDDTTANDVRQWLGNGYNADMAYLNNYTDKRLDPRLLMDGVKSIVCVALNYTPAKHIPLSEFQVATYAYGQDYHDIVKRKLQMLANKFGIEPVAVNDEPANTDHPHFRAFCDSAPILERYWAEKAGLGWTGRNHQLIIPHAGSMFFLGELFLDIELEYDKPMKNRCGKCHACIDACPTNAISTGKGGFDANRCLSYQTIENKGDINDDIASKMGHTIYGCDRCQQACPWNRFASPNDTPELQPKKELLEMTRDKWKELTEDDYRKLFKGSAVKRAKYSGLMRNIHAADKNEE